MCLPRRGQHSEKIVNRPLERIPSFLRPRKARASGSPAEEQAAVLRLALLCAGLEIKNQERCSPNASNIFCRMYGVDPVESGDRQGSTLV